MSLPQLRQPATMEQRILHLAPRDPEGSARLVPADDQSSQRAAFARANRVRQGDEPKQRESRRVYSILRTAIRDRTLGANELLVESTLMRELRATRTAVRHALSQLAADHLVIRLPRVGTVVRDVFERVELGVQVHTDDKFVITTIDTRIITTAPVICAKLGLPADSPVLMAEYFIEAGGQPFCIETCYWAPDAVPRVPFVLDVGDDLPSSFERHFGRALKRSETTVEAIRCDEHTQKALDVPADAPLLLSQKVLYDEDDTPREVQYIYYAATRAYFSLEQTFQSSTGQSSTGQ
jgi:GntR family transcriptional regulator